MFTRKQIIWAIFSLSLLWNILLELLFTIILSVFAEEWFKSSWITVLCLVKLWLTIFSIFSYCLFKRISVINLCLRLVKSNMVFFTFCWNMLMRKWKLCTSVCFFFSVFCKNTGIQDPWPVVLKYSVFIHVPLIISFCWKQPTPKLSAWKNDF